MNHYIHPSIHACMHACIPTHLPTYIYVHAFEYAHILVCIYVYVFLALALEQVRRGLRGSETRRPSGALARYTLTGDSASACIHLLCTSCSRYSACTTSQHPHQTWPQTARLANHCTSRHGRHISDISKIHVSVWKCVHIYMYIWYAFVCVCAGVRTCAAMLSLITPATWSF